MSNDDVCNNHEVVQTDLHMSIQSERPVVVETPSQPSGRATEFLRRISSSKKNHVYHDLYFLASHRLPV